MTQIGLDPHQAAVSELSDPALIALVRRDDGAAIEELVRRHALAMTRFEATIGMAVTPDPAQRVSRLSEDPTLPLRAAWLADRATDLVHDADDAFLLARFTELTTAWRTALWHAEVEGDSPAAIAQLLGIDPTEAALTVRTARNRLAWAVVELTPAGASQECLDTAARLCSVGADPRPVLGLAAAHGRDCDDCMLLVKRCLLLASSLRESLLRTVAGEMATAYDAARPPAYRPRARGDLAGTLVQCGRPAAVTLAMAGAAAAAVAALVVGPGAVSPYFSPEREVYAGVALGRLLSPVSRTAAAPPANDPSPRLAAFSPEDLSPELPSSGKDEQRGRDDDKGKDTASGTTEPGGSVDEQVDVPAPTGGDGSPAAPAPTPPTSPPAPTTSAPNPAQGGDDGGDPAPSPVPPVQISVGPVTVDTGGDAPLVEVDGPLPLEVPPLPDLGSIGESAGGIVPGLLG